MDPIIAERCPKVWLLVQSSVRYPRGYVLLGHTLNFFTPSLGSLAGHKCYAAAARFLSFAALPKTERRKGRDMGGLHLLFEPHRRLEVLYLRSKIVILIGEMAHQVCHAVG